MIKVATVFSGIGAFTINGTASFTVTSLIEEGNGDFFIYQEGKRIYSIGFPYNDTIVLSDVTGKIYFRIAGESAKMEITITKI